ncbi:MAG: CDP-alcohol phosphatidyltransferase family protein [Bryobacteraceae bacterium]|nr:CDP-alcohol phosphatidyltransferase family protein [Bryobacteraceae bacterium]
MRPAALLPNILTASRLLLTPLIARAILQGNYGTAIAIFGAAGVTDAVDGAIARRMGVATRAGAYLDPVVDKLFVTVTYVCLGWTGSVPWWLVGLALTRDALILAVTGTLLLFTRYGGFRPSVWGKAATATHIVTMTVVLARQATGWEGLTPATELLIAAAAAITVWSGLHYAWTTARRVTRPPDSEDSEQGN